MIRTPEQAAEAWCRHVRVLAAKGPATALEPSPAVSFNRIIAPDGTVLPRGSFCLAAACMSWRWWDPSYVVLVVNPRDVKPETMKRLADDGYERWPDGDRDGGHGYRMPIKTRRGYCGADSKPVHPE